MLKKSHAAALAALVLLPAALVLYQGLSVWKDDQTKVRQRVQGLLQERLADGVAAMASQLNQRTAAVQTALVGPGATDLQWLDLSRRDPWVRQVFRQDGAGKLVYPATGRASLAEAEFLARTEKFRRDYLSFSTPDRREPGLAGQWFNWYWDEGGQWIWAVKEPTGAVTGAWMSRSAILADLITAWQPIIPAAERTGHRIQLVDAQGHRQAQWGGTDRDGTVAGEVLAERSLPAPLTGWRLTYELDPRFWPAEDQAAGLSLLLSLSAFVLVLLALGGYLAWFLTRAWRDARDRISFVNQVSHELKTPLTNIRLYADLLEADLPSDAGRAADRLDIIRQEAGRLSRMIHNVLTFSHRDKGLRLNLAETSPDEVLTKTLQVFGPALADKGLVLTTTLAAASLVLVDADALDQIFGNLLSNVEKYAAEGRQVQVASWLSTTAAGTVLHLTVRDHGPGIPASSRRRLFQPFERLHTRVTDAAGGTGLGLFLSRELARLHGGDLTVEVANPGCLFHLTLREGGRL